MNALLSDRWIEIGVAAVCVIIVAVVGGLMTEVGEWYEGLRFPSWRPPNWLFGPAWTMIYLLIATSSVMAWERAPDGASRRWLLVLLAINGGVEYFMEPAVLQAETTGLGVHRTVALLGVDTRFAHSY